MNKKQKLEEVKNEQKKAGFLKRAEAYVLDMFICAMVASMIFSGLDLIFKFETPVTDKYEQEVTELMEQYQNVISSESENKDETVDETEEDTTDLEETPITEDNTETEEILDLNTYTEKLNEISEKYYADMYLEGVPSTLISLVVSVLYFVLLAFYMKGQTLGKKFLNIRVVDKKGNAPTFNQLLIRSVIFYSFYATIIELVLIFVSKSSFYNASSVIDTVSTSIVLISIVLVLLDKSKRGLHDLAAGTSVVVEEN